MKHATSHSLHVFLLYMFYVSFQDLQVEIESHQKVFDSLANSSSDPVTDATGVKPANTTSEATPRKRDDLRRRIDQMNQRWSQLKSKSVEIRLVSSSASSVVPPRRSFLLSQFFTHHKIVFFFVDTGRMNYCRF